MQLNANKTSFSQSGNANRSLHRLKHGVILLEIETLKISLHVDFSSSLLEVLIVDDRCQNGSILRLVPENEFAEISMFRRDIICRYVGSSCIRIGRSERIGSLDRVVLPT